MEMGWGINIYSYLHKYTPEKIWRLEGRFSLGSFTFSANSPECWIILTQRENVCKLQTRITISEFGQLWPFANMQKKTPARSTSWMGWAEAKLSSLTAWVFLFNSKIVETKIAQIWSVYYIVLGTSKEHRQWLGWSHPTVFFPVLIDPYPNCGPTITSKYCFCWKPHGCLSSSFSKAAAQTLSKKITWAEKLGQFLLGKPFILATLPLGLPKNNTWADHPCGEKTWSPILWPCSHARRPPKAKRDVWSCSGGSIPLFGMDVRCGWKQPTFTQAPTPKKKTVICPWMISAVDF